jgi:hypothetical protein
VSEERIPSHPTMTGQIADHFAQRKIVATDVFRRDRCFIDYWMGSGTWKQTPEQRKQPIAASVKNVRRWPHALFTEPTPLEAFRSLMS